jgi:hypothetical protein
MKATKGTPWLALLVLSSDNGEIVVSRDGGAAAGTTGARPVALREYLSPPSRTLGPVFSNARDEGQLLADHPDPGFEPGNPPARNPGIACMVVDVARDAWVAVAPALDELAYLAHVRDSPAGDEAVLGAGRGAFSVVTANRLPGRPGGRFVAHLVSLEGFAGYLPGQANEPSAQCDAVRLLSLARWEFASGSGPAPMDSTRRLSLGALRMPVAPPARGATRTKAEEAVEAALAHGFVGLPRARHDGTRETALYRGPCHPVPSAHAPQARYAKADEPRHEATGLADTSLATAWQLGRLLALCNRGFAEAIAPWMRENLANGYLLAARLEDPPPVAATARAEQGPPAVGALREPDAITRTAESLLGQMLSPDGELSLVTGLAPPTDPTGVQDRHASFPGVLPPAELEKVVAGGGDPHKALRDHMNEGGEDAA